MLKPVDIQGFGNYGINTYDGRTIEYPDVLVSNFESPDRESALVLTNYLHDEKEIVLPEKRRIYTDSKDETNSFVSDRVVIKPLSAIIAEKI